MVVKYGEIGQALTQLGFKDEPTPELFLSVRETRKVEVRLPYRPDETRFAKINTLGISNILFMQGIIKHPDNLVKMIVKNRLPMKAKREMA